MDIHASFLGNHVSHYARPGMLHGVPRIELWASMLRFVGVHVYECKQPRMSMLRVVGIQCAYPRRRCDRPGTCVESHAFVVGVHVLCVVGECASMSGEIGQPSRI